MKQEQVQDHMYHRGMGGEVVMVTKAMLLEIIFSNPEMPPQGPSGCGIFVSLVGNFVVQFPSPNTTFLQSTHER